MRPPPMQAKEREGVLMAPDPSAPPHVQGDYPEWLAPHLASARSGRTPCPKAWRWPRARRSTCA